MATQAMKNEQFDLVSVLYHTSQGAATAGRYLTDARQAGDDDLARYMEDVRQQYAKLAHQGQELLKKRLQ